MREGVFPTVTGTVVACEQALGTPLMPEEYL